MKNILTQCFIIFLCISCKAQTITISTTNTDSETPIGGYYKDTNNLLSQYEGTWLYTNGTTSITVKLRKITNFYNGRYYQDMLVGEFQYIENGIEKINTLNQFNTNFSNPFDHKLYGNSLWNVNHKPFPCNDCNIAIKRVLISFDDILKDIIGDMYFGISDTNSNVAKVFVRSDGIRTILTDPNDISTGVTSQAGVTIPNGWYTFVKQ